VTELAFESLDYDEAVARLRENGIERIHRLEIPHGPCASFHVADGQRIAVYELTRPEAAASFDGRIDE
jgi:hypothetical protein